MIGVGDEASFAQEPGHDVEIIYRIPIGGAARTVAARHQNYVAFGYSGRCFLPNPVDNVATNVDVSQKPSVKRRESDCAGKYVFAV